jgi:putative glutamine amidotransferase
LDGRNGTHHAHLITETRHVAGAAGDGGADVTTARPLIGVTGHRHRADGGRSQLVSAVEAYLQAISAAGGIPVILPPLEGAEEAEAIQARVDGVLFTGGRDIDPRHFGETVLNETVHVEPDRDAFELPLTRAAVARDVPLFAICRGCQVLNVALGGDLWQDLPSQRPSGLLHSQQAPRHAVTHQLQLAPGTLLAAILGLPPGTPLESNSFHHQAVREVPQTLVVTARAADGTIEAVEAPGRRFVLGVQWHPEHLAAHRPEHRRLFEAFVRAAAGARRDMAAATSTLSTPSRKHQ